VVRAIAAIVPETYPDSIGILVENLLRRLDLTPETQEVVLSTIEKLAKLNNFSWFRLFFRRDRSAFDTFSPEQWRRVLICLSTHPRLDYHVEELLILAAEKD
jgi:hypothetical protein